MRKTDITVINSRGEKELFSWNKVYRSARRSGASAVLAKKIANEISETIYQNASTQEIFNKIKKSLKKVSFPSALRFSLKEGMRKLGPTGFPFEKYVREILNRNGFTTEINLHLKGKCALYEIDFLARKGDTLYIGECKYHHLPGERVDLKVALYNYARFLDLKNSKYFGKTQSSLKLKPMLVTNAKFTSQVIKYSKCVDVELLGWNYPRNKGLEYLIDKEKLYPITVLPSLKGYLKDIFFENKIALVNDLISRDSKRLSNRLNIPEKVINRLIRESKTLLNR